MTPLRALHGLVHNRSQLRIAPRSPILMAYPEAVVYQLNETGIAPVAYGDTEHYRVARRFLQNHRHMLDILLFADG